MGETSFDRATEAMGNTLDQLKAALQELKETREQYNTLVDNTELVCAAFMSLMQKHKYTTQIAFDLETLQAARDGYNLNVAGEDGQAIFTIENRKLSYEKFVKGDTHVADEILQVEDEAEGQERDRDLSVLGDGLQEEGVRRGLLPGVLAPDTSDSPVPDNDG